MFFLLAQAFGTFNKFSVGIVVTFAAFMTGSLADFVLNQIRRPLDRRAIREEPARLFAEAQLRYQMVLPIMIVIGLLAANEGDALWLALVVPFLLAAQAAQLWNQAIKEPLKADLRNVDLSNAYLRKANCTHVDFTGANLRLADLAGADVTSAQFRGARLDNVNLGGIDLTVIEEGLTKVQLG